MTGKPITIPRVAPKALEYVKTVLDFGFHNAHSVGMTARLERDFAKRFGQTYGIAHCNGTATMQSALMAAGVGVGDEVIVPAFTVFATPAVALHCNAVPVIVDVDPDTWTISVFAIRNHLPPPEHERLSRLPFPDYRPIWTRSCGWPKRTTSW